MAVWPVRGRGTRRVQQGLRGVLRPRVPAEAEPPLRAELFGLAQLENHARAIAAGHAPVVTRRRERLLHRLRENREIIRRSHAAAAQAARQNVRVGPAEEWLLDNFYVVEEQIDLAFRHLPPGYSRQLPRLNGGALDGFPRVYDVALTLVAHTDGHVDDEHLSAFVRAYQEVKPLSLGELWAIPIMVRLTLIENLRRVAQRIAWRRGHRDAAQVWARRFLHTVQTEPRALLVTLADFVRADPPRPAPFVAELATQIEGVHPALGMAIDWLEQELAERGQTIAVVRQAESQEQAADQASVANSIASLRGLAGIDWRAFVETLSVTESVLRRDPSADYVAMDFRSRDAYRHAVEALAKGCGRPEQDVAAEVVRRAAACGGAAGGDPRETHVGYFLVGAGRDELERALGYRAPLAQRPARRLVRRPLADYRTLVLLLTALPAMALILAARPLAAAHPAAWLALAAVVFLALSRTGVALANAFVMRWLPPRGLPRLDFAKGIPDAHRTAVVVPGMLTSAEGVDRMLERLEMRYLVNRQPNLLFALLTDFTDAPEPCQPDDVALLDRAVDGIRQVNARYAAPGQDLFFLLHRPREWNPGERAWMGYERKRGKLEAFNRLVQEGVSKPFSTVEGNPHELRAVRYVITLDEDTQLPPDSAWKMVATLAHPLHRPYVDPQTGTVTRGYGVLQPRLAVSLVAAARSRFARIFAGEVGLDPYTRQVSNLYQDLFGEAAFVGKGVYDVAAFDAAVGRRFPPNRILSHDLIEGAHARCGFLNDVELIEDQPAHVLVDLQRRHRWVRGDWQIARWLWPRVPGPDGARVRNPLGGLAKWMIADNLRRSLVPAAWLLAFLAGWTVLPHAAFAWSLLAFYLLPDLLRTAGGAAAGRGRDPWLAHVVRTAVRERRAWSAAALDLAFLPCEALLYADAIARTLWRLWISRRRRLQWVTADVSERDARGGFAATLHAMAPVPLLAAAAATTAVVAGSPAAGLAVAIGAWWALSPATAWFVSRPRRTRVAALTEPQAAFLGRIAWRTWRYFDTFVVSEHHDLPPDNVQEIPVLTVAGRTSPTNIGLALLANLAAYDLGYLGAGGLVVRTERTFATLDRLPRYRGHFYNWYDTRTLEPLHPFYVSSVDSGNLAGHLAALRGGLLELPAQPALPARWRAGLRDAAASVIEAFEAVGARPAATAALHALAPLADTAAGSAPPALSEMQRTLADTLAAIAAVQAHAAPPGDEAGGLAALRRQTEGLRGELLQVAPWLTAEDGAWFARARAAAADPALAAVVAELETMPTLERLATLHSRLGAALDRLAAAPGPAAPFAERLRDDVTAASERATQRIEAIEDLATRADEFAQFELDFLYDPARKLLAIGYNLDRHQRDPSLYDLLGSEARLCSYIGVARGQLPFEHWFRLGRAVAPGRGTPVLVSWSGSLFEYLMPELVLPAPPETLLAAACEGAVRRQIRYGRRQGVPWGISESAYNRVDAQQTYQYRAFGVPGLGLKRGLGDDLVVAPYASALALLVAPAAACRNLQTLWAEGLAGPYGLYEAVDYTRSRLRPDERREIVRAHMAHHSGMSLVALDEALLGRNMERRFLADPALRACEGLLNERVPPRGMARPRTTEAGPEREAPAGVETAPRVFTRADTPSPEVHLLSNGRLHVAVSHAGGGWYRWQDLAVTRWREDATCDNWGAFLYVKDVHSGRFWSVAPQPVIPVFDRFRAVFSPSAAEFESACERIATHVRIAVSPEDDIELRRVTLANESGRRRTLELTTYAEVVLMDGRAEAGHPAFFGLFVETQAPVGPDALLCTRRPRSAGETPPWLLHTLSVHGRPVDAGASCETDRARFLGRGRTPRNPAALQAPGPLSNTVGAVLDPIVALRRRIDLAPGERVTVDIVLGVTRTREEALRLVDKYRDRHLAERVFGLAWTDHQVLLDQLRVGEPDIQIFETLAGFLLYANPRLRAAPSLIARNRRGQSALWSHGVSGDLPIVLLRIADHGGLDLVRQVIQAHAFWRHKGLRVDVVIWAESYAGYRQPLLDAIRGAVHASSEAKLLDQAGGIFVQGIDTLPEEDQVLFQAVARVVLSDRSGRLAEQVARRLRMPSVLPRDLRAHADRPRPRAEAAPETRDLRFFNGYGGFTADGREYVILLRPNLATPLPWINVLANPRFGTVVTETGGGYTWYANAHECRLTPWTNDAVSDPAGEAWYLRDEETGAYWSPMPRSATSPAPYVCRHGLGYTVFEHTRDGIASEATVYVAADAPAKFVAIVLRNHSDRARRVSVTGYCEWVLGESRDHHAMHVVTRLDPQSRALFAWNAFTVESPARVAFFHCSAGERTATADRAEFIGRNGSLAQPAALRREHLSNRVGAGWDPCGALQTVVHLPPGETREVVFVLGAAGSEEEAHAVLRRFGGVGGGRQALEAVWQFWKEQLGGVYVETPDPSVDPLVNHWLLYQVLAARFWGRSGFYQSGGAYGFRDQLQDSLAFLQDCAWLTRQHLLTCAGRQFRQGDVQHWWHPPGGRGTRTRISDDVLWLPYALCRYVETTADRGVLDESIPFLDGRPLNPGEESYYDKPQTTDERAPLYEHAARAVRASLRFGPHGLPLIQTGDWNDGMNRVGHEGRGESVWLAFFLYDVLCRFGRLAAERPDPAFAQECKAVAARLRVQIEAHAWDGAWYRRAYFDDGTPLGSAQNPECQIDLLPQAWAVLSGAADEPRVGQALDAVQARLVDEKHALIRIFTPPFDKAPWDPGYIKGYVPGIRENGGQYTHAAVWTVMAFAERHDAARAWQMFGMLNPIRHGDTAEREATYKVEPYVVAADVYTAPGQKGRGGWTWYTGAAGWMYQLLVEKLLGVTRRGETLRVAPLLPADWPGFTLHYRYRGTFYHIRVTKTGAETWRIRRWTLDGVEQPADAPIPLVDDHREHEVTVEAGV